MTTPAAAEFLVDRHPAVVIELPEHAKAGTGVVGNLNSQALAGGGVILVLADGRRLEARVQKVSRNDRDGTQSWVGAFEDVPGSVLAVSGSRGAAAGFANVGTSTYEIRRSKGGSYVLYELDPARLPRMK